MSDFPAPMEYMVPAVLLIVAVICILCLGCYVFESGGRQQSRAPVNESFIQNEGFTRVSGNTLDLHHLSMDNAISVLADFLNVRRKEYNLRGQGRYCYIITGQGNRSAGGQPVLKPKVEDYLDRRGYRYSLENPGKFEVDLKI